MGWFSDNTFKAYAVDADGEQTLIEAKKLLIVLGKDKAITIELNHVKGLKEKLELTTDAGGPESSYTNRLTVHPSAPNELHLGIDRQKM